MSPAPWPDREPARNAVKSWRRCKAWVHNIDRPASSNSTARTGHPAIPPLPRQGRPARPIPAGDAPESPDQARARPPPAATRSPFHTLLPRCLNLQSSARIGPTPGLPPLAAGRAVSIPAPSRNTSSALSRSPAARCARTGPATRSRGWIASWTGLDDLSGLHRRHPGRWRWPDQGPSGGQHTCPTCAAVCSRGYTEAGAGPDGRTQGCRLPPGSDDGLIQIRLAPTTLKPAVQCVPEVAQYSRPGEMAERDGVDCLAADDDGLIQVRLAPGTLESCTQCGPEIRQVPGRSGCPTGAASTASWPTATASSRSACCPVRTKRAPSASPRLDRNPGPLRVSRCSGVDGFPADRDGLIQVR